MALDRLIATGLIFALVFATLAYGTVEPWSLAIFEFIITAITVLWAFRMVADREIEVKLPATTFPIAALLAVALIQCVSFRGSDGRVTSLSDDVEATRAATVVLFFMLLCFVVGANFFTTRDRLRKLSVFLVVFGMAIAIFGLIQYFTWSGRIYWFRQTQWNTVFGPFVNRNHYAGFIEMLAPIPVALIVTRGVKREAWLIYGFGAALMGLTVFVSLSRGGMISLLAGMMFLAAASSRARHHDATSESTESMSRRRGTRKRAALAKSAGAVAVIIVAIAAGVFWMGPDSVIDRAAQSFEKVTDQQSAYLGRNWVWTDTLSLIKSYPLLGAGLGAYQTTYPRFSHGDGTTIIEYAHNDYLQVLADAGIVGLAIAGWFIYLLFRAVFRGVRSRDPLLAGLSLGCGGAAFSILVHSLFDFNLQIPSNALLFLFLSAVVSHIATTVEERVPSAALRRVERADVAGLARGVES